MTGKNHYPQILRYIGLLALFLLGGSVTGYVLANNNRPDPDRIKWEQMPAPPEPAIKIVELGGNGRDGHSITIETANGTQFECCGPWPATWTRLNYNRTRYGTACDQITSSLIDKLPDRPVDCAYESQFEWVTGWYYAAVMPDGSVWRWRYYFGLPTILEGMAAGAMAGFAIGIIGIFINQKMRSKRSTTG